MRIELETKRGELISVEEVKRVWNEAIIFMRDSLYQLPLKFSDRWASETDGGAIQDEMIRELDVMCRKFAEEGEKVVTQDDENISGEAAENETS